MQALTYAPAGATCPAESGWADEFGGFRRFETSVVIGRGERVWEEARQAVLCWGVKQRSGFRVVPDSRVVVGAEYRVSVGWGPLSVHEPVRVVAVVDNEDRCGFAYGTLPGHPVCGEEAFVVHRRPDGIVEFTLRSLTKPAPAGYWRRLFPILLVAQRHYRRRYLRALLS
ncbi:uncharacterized protein (UPF0548 family) [Nocardia caishijiensis]|uniref:Uncharacterized protein (UPF0548 family) n=2 Tax=Nocardia caishijiensis TaxID=184756 RepID=A0ABQ6YJN4_9NOCA|nr:uncharacterized protein (UPF0548 family) [Nocardia caishijiensis]